MNAIINQFSLSGDDAEFSEIDITKYTTVHDANVTLMLQVLMIFL